MSAITLRVGDLLAHSNDFMLADIGDIAGIIGFPAPASYQLPDGLVVPDDTDLMLMYECVVLGTWVSFRDLTPDTTPHLKDKLDSLDISYIEGGVQ